MIQRLPVFAAAAYLALFLLVGEHVAPERFGDLSTFALSFERQVRQAGRLLFPVGVGASIVTLLALLHHMNVVSRRGRLQLLALGLLFGNGVFWATFGEPAADRVVAAARAGDTVLLEGLLGDWRAFEMGSLGLAVAVVVSLLLASRHPVAVASRGRLADLTPRHRSLLFLLGTATLFEGYDRFIVSLALPYIGDDLGAEEGTLGLALSAIRLGALASILLGRVADRHGRRRILLATILAYTLATAATGLSRNIVEFVLFQLLATIFLVTELSLAQVVVTEEFPASFRALGQGLLGAFAALGAGMAALLFPVFQESTLGWRGLYFLGILPLLLVAWLRRAMPETERWELARSRGETREVRLRELFEPALRSRFLTLLVVATAMTAAAGPAFAFASYRATKTFGWEPADVSTMILLGGGCGMVGWFVFGFLAEHLGRRWVGVMGTAGGGLAAIAFYQSAWLFPAFASLVFMEAGAQIALNALGTELFPTRLRGTAKAWITNAWIIGAMIGLAGVGVLSDSFGSVEAVVGALALLPMLASVSLLRLPEPRGQELEEIAFEKSPSAPR